MLHGAQIYLPLPRRGRPGGSPAGGARHRTRARAGSAARTSTRGRHFACKRGYFGIARFVLVQSPSHRLTAIITHKRATSRALSPRSPLSQKVSTHGVEDTTQHSLSSRPLAPRGPIPRSAGLGSSASASCDRAQQGPAFSPCGRDSHPGSFAALSAPICVSRPPQC